ncbi:MAG: hypothetical protein NZL96_03610 [Patescibacteria group bacterium]|nr:hypothetical protein [Patescibacteria group bacterium]
MDNFNRIVSFVLGLVVVVVFFAVVTGRIDLRRYFSNPNRQSQGRQVISPTPSLEPKRLSVSSETVVSPSPEEPVQTLRFTTTPQTIPAAGLPSFFIPVLFGLGMIGLSLKKIDKS